jgi:nitroreductase
MAADYRRTAAKYGVRAERYVPMEVGHAAQNVYLQCAARRLATAFVGAFDDRQLHDVLGLPRDHTPLGIMPLGHARER